MKPDVLQLSTASQRFSAVAYPAGWRFIAAVLFLSSRLSPFLIAVAFFLGWVISPPLLVRLVLLLMLLPGMALWLLRRLFAVDCHWQGSSVALHQRGLLAIRRKRVNVVEVDQIEPWSLPLPAAGVNLPLVGGANTRRMALEVRGPGDGFWNLPFPKPMPGLAEASLLYSRVRIGSRLARWHWPWFKFGVFGLFPVLVAFRLHQNIMYGGLFGQYYFQGLAPWLSSLAYHWIVYTIYLVLFAAFWRGWVELGCWAGARFLPARAGTFRRWGEALALAVYFIGIPAFIVWRSVV